MAWLAFNKSEVKNGVNTSLTRTGKSRPFLDLLENAEIVVPRVRCRPTLGLILVSMGLNYGILLRAEPTNYDSLLPSILVYHTSIFFSQFLINNYCLLLFFQVILCVNCAKIIFPI